jgi:hypothetical protein
MDREPDSCGFCGEPLNGSTWRDFDTDARICVPCATDGAEVRGLTMEMEELPDGTWDASVAERGEIEA